MPERDGYIPGVPCWVGTGHPDPRAAVPFYGDLFGWAFDEEPPAGGGEYFIGRIRGGDVAGIGAAPDGVAAWHTYVWIDDVEEAVQRVRRAGGTVTSGPVDLGDAGRMAEVSDPEGASFRIWQPKAHRGARVVNEHGSLNFNGLATRDAGAAEAFYGTVFGWRLLELASGPMWALPGYGDHLEEATPGLRDQMEQMGAPDGFVDVVAAIEPIPAADGDTAAHWTVTFGVDDVDVVVQRAGELGGSVVVEPVDVPWSRSAVLADPQGVVFTASQFVPENRDLDG